MTKFIVPVAFSLILMAVQVGSGGTHRVKNIPSGKWGGAQVNLVVKGSDVSFEFGCATGRNTAPAVLDRKGRFDFTGTYADLYGSPSAKAGSHPARYTGSVHGNRMTLKIRLTDSNESLPGYELEYGKSSRLDKCPVPAPRPS